MTPYLTGATVGGKLGIALQHHATVHRSEDPFLIGLGVSTSGHGAAAQHGTGSVDG
jgi:hypothetical protein